MDHFLPFYSPNNSKNQTFEKMKKPLGDIIILHRCTINDNHMMYLWFQRYWARQTEFFIILDQFHPFTHLWTQKIKILKKLKKSTGTYYHFTNMCHKWQSHDVCSWDMEYNGQNFYCHFGPYFALLPPNNAKNQNLKKWENHLKTSLFYTDVP